MANLFFPEMLFIIVERLSFASVKKEILLKTTVCCSMFANVFANAAIEIIHIMTQHMDNVKNILMIGFGHDEKCVKTRQMFVICSLRNNIILPNTKRHTQIAHEFRLEFFFSLHRIAMQWDAGRGCSFVCFFISKSF